MLGEMEVTALSDGTIPFKTHDLLTNVKASQLDAGAGALFAPAGGKLLANFKASGYQPEQVDEIYIAHMHGARRTLSPAGSTERGAT